LAGPAVIAPALRLSTGSRRTSPSFTFEHLGARVYPDMFSLAQAHNAFTEEERIANAQLQERFETNIANFMDLVEAAKHYPCVKRAWVEYLGEHPDPVIDRVQ
jgi:chromate reductase, NAD(P)H dehydrogenase (quinone)